MSARNLLVAHGGGPTAVMNASLAGTVAEAQRQGAVDRIFAARRGIEGVVANDLVELTSMSGAELERLSQTPATAIGSCRTKVT
jgi:ATP-dependent phosphofructokinase / diphosphate-dependent phosphofructokinase